MLSRSTLGTLQYTDSICYLEKTPSMKRVKRMFMEHRPQRLQSYFLTLSVRGKESLGKKHGPASAMTGIAQQGARMATLFIADKY